MVLDHPDTMSKASDLPNGMMTNSVSDDKIYCGVCGRRYRLPRILPCLHTFCSDCISNLQTYPTNDEEDLSGDSDHAVDWLLLTGSGSSAENLLDTFEKPKTPAGYESTDVHQETLPRGRSRHAKLIEKRIQRSRSCTDGGFELNTSSQEDQLMPRSPSKGCLKRSSSSKGSKLNFTSPLVSKSSAKSSDFINSSSMFSVTSASLEEKKRIILCPKCLKEVKVSMTLDELPRNFMVERFVAEEALLSCSSSLTCDSCFEHDKDNSDDYGCDNETTNKNVTARCVECQENLCSLCEFSHRRQKKTKRHQLILVEYSMNSNDSSSNSSSMSTIPESVNEESLTVGKQHSLKRSNPLKKITSLKLPNLQQFGYLLWNNSRPGSSSSGEARGSNGFQCQEENSTGDVGVLPDAKVEVQDQSSGGESPDCVYSRIVKRRSGKMAGHPRRTKVDKTRPMSCLKHPEEELKMFCVTCEESVCRDCIVLLHREHVCQMVTKELFQNQMDDVDRLIKTVIPKVEAVDDHLATLADLKIKVTERSEKVKGEINSFMDTFVEAIEKHRKHLLSQVSSLADAKDRMLTVSQLHLQHMRSDVEQTCRFVAELLMGASDMEILSMKKLVTQRLRTLQNVENDPHVQLNGFLRFCPTEKGEVINNFQMFGIVVARKPCAAKSFLEGDGLSTARISHTCVMVLTVCDTDGVPYNGSDVKIRAWIIFQEQSMKSIPVTLLHLKDGTHQLEFTPLYKGTHFLHVALNGHSVKDSPFKFSVKTRWRKHQGVWQCCTFCSTNGRKDVPCGCGGTMKGGYLGCGHAHKGHPGGHHWSCCGKMTHNSECARGSSRSSPLRQVTL